MMLNMTLFSLIVIQDFLSAEYEYKPVPENAAAVLILYFFLTFIHNLCTAEKKNMKKVILVFWINMGCLIVGFVTIATINYKIKNPNLPIGSFFIII